MQPVRRQGEAVAVDLEAVAQPRLHDALVPVDLVDQPVDVGDELVGDVADVAGDDGAEQQPAEAGRRVDGQHEVAEGEPRASAPAAGCATPRARPGASPNGTGRAPCGTLRRASDVLRGRGERSVLGGADDVGRRRAVAVDELAASVDGGRRRRHLRPRADCDDAVRRVGRVELRRRGRAARSRPTAVVGVAWPGGRTSENSVSTARPPAAPSAARRRRARACPARWRRAARRRVGLGVGGHDERRAVPAVRHLGLDRAPGSSVWRSPAGHSSSPYSTPASSASRATANGPSSSSSRSNSSSASASSSSGTTTSSPSQTWARSASASASVSSARWSTDHAGHVVVHLDGVGIVRVPVEHEPRRYCRGARPAAVAADSLGQYGWGMPTSSRRPDRNLAMELVRVTESAALAASRWVGRGDKNGADGAAVAAMRTVLSTVTMDGIVVIGEGEKDDAPMLFNGEQRRRRHAAAGRRRRRPDRRHHAHRRRAARTPCR